MKMNVLKKMGMVCLGATIVFYSCEKSDDGPKGIYDEGIFITNEGAWGNNNGSISFYSYATDSLTNEIYAKENNDLTPGDVIQSMALYKEEAWIVANGSNNIVVTDRYDFTHVTLIEGLNNPRHLAFYNNKAYLSEWGDNGVVLVLNAETKLAEDTIKVGTGPERMLLHNNTLWVANSGAYSRDSTLSVIDISTGEVSNTIKVNDNPVDLAVDKNGDVWVLCVGYIQYDPVNFSIVVETGSSLVVIDAQTLQIKKEIEIAANQHPTHLEINETGDEVFVGGGYGYPGVYKININDTEYPTTAFINKSAYAIGYDNHLKSLFVLEAPTFTGKGIATRYNNIGEVVNVFETGIGPNGLAVKY